MSATPSTSFGAARQAITAKGPVGAARALLARQRFEVEQTYHAMDAELRRGHVAAEAVLEARAILDGEIPPPPDDHEVPAIVGHLRAEARELRALNNELVRRTTAHEGETSERIEAADRGNKLLLEEVHRLRKTCERYGARIGELVDRVTHLEQKPAVKGSKAAPSVPGEPSHRTWIEKTLPLDVAAVEAGVPVELLLRVMAHPKGKPLPLRVPRSLVERIKNAGPEDVIQIGDVEISGTVGLDELEERPVTTNEEADAAIEEAFAATEPPTDAETDRRSQSAGA